MQETQSAVLSTHKDQSTDPLFSSDDAARYIGVASRTMAVWRCTGRYDIPYIKVGRLAKYRKSALDVYLERHTHGGEG